MRKKVIFSIILCLVCLALATCLVACGDKQQEENNQNGEGEKDDQNRDEIKEEKDIIVKHFIDSILIEKEVKGEKLIDIGSGAGFPGIPLKIVRNDLDVTLIDSVNKKVLFMQDSIDKLKLDNIIAVHCRAEDYAHNKKYRETFDVVTSRAVANMSTLVEYMLPFVKVGGKCICMKGPNSEEEIKSFEQIKIDKVEGNTIYITKI